MRGGAVWGYMIDKALQEVVGVHIMKDLKICPMCEGVNSRRGKYCCYACSAVATAEANKQLREKKGPIYEKWKKGIKRYIAGV